MIRTGYSLILLGVLLSGCAGRLQTTPYLERTETLSGALRGVTYSLPKLQYTGKLTRYLSECPGDVIDGNPTALKFGVKIEAAPEYVPGEAYSINYERLSGVMRTSNFDIKYWPNGNLKSIGAGADDKTADVAKDIVKTALALWSATAGVPVVPLPGTASANFLPVDDVDCTEQAAQWVKDARFASEQIGKSTKELERLKKEIERIEKRATLRLASRQDRETLLQHFSKVDQEEATLAAAKKSLDDVSGKLSVTQGFQWSGRRDQYGAKQNLALDLSDNHKIKLAALLRRRPTDSPGDEADAVRRQLFPRCFGPAVPTGELADPLQCLGQQLNMTVTVAVRQDVKSCPDEDSAECVSVVKASDARFQHARDPTADSGIFAREAVQGQLLFCRTARGDCNPAIDEAKLAPANFPQLGQLRFLPLTVKPFQAKELALTMTEDGRVESFSYKSTKAAAQAIAATAADVATQIDAALEKRETEYRSDLDYQRAQATAEVQAEITRLTKDLELKKAQAALAPDPLKPLTDETASLKAEIALLDAQLAKLKAERALAEATRPDAS